jgi:hypothetical protein
VSAVDLLIGVVTTLVGLAFVVMPWVCGLTANSLAATTIVAGGVIVTLLGLVLARRAPRPLPPGRPQR